MQQAAFLRAQRVGGDLRTARERLGWSLADTSAYVRIRRPLLEALEEGRIGDLPGPAYALGFIRTYALALGVDAEEMVRRFHAEVGAEIPAAVLRFPAPLPQRNVPAGAVVMLGALLAVVGYIGWYRVSGERVAVTVQQVPARLAPLALPVVALPPAHVAAVTPAPGIVSGFVPSIVPPGAAEAGVPAPGSLAPVEPPLAAAPGVAAQGHAIVLSATADAWVQIKDGAGTIVLSKLMHSGDSWPVPDAAPGQSPYRLTTGNAGGTVLSVNGKAAAPLGGPGVVKHDVALDPATLAAGTAAQ